MNLKMIYNFLSELRINNNRDWFKEKNSLYQDAKLEFETFIEDIILRIKQFDDDINITSAKKEAIFRIFRDARFSKNKVPYKTNFGAFIALGGRKSINAGYYIHFEPGNSFLGGGIYMPQSNELKKIRTEIYNNPSKFKSIIENKKFKKIFPKLYGEKLKSAPRGFSKDFEDIELLKNKHFTVTHNLEDSFWFDDPTIITKKIIDIFKIQYKFNSFLNKAVK